MDEETKLQEEEFKKRTWEMIQQRKRDIEWYNQEIGQRTHYEENDPRLPSREEMNSAIEKYERREKVKRISKYLLTLLPIALVVLYVAKPK